MPNLTSKEYSTFKNIARMTQEELHKALYQVLRDIYGDSNVISHPYYICATGDIPIALVAHMDTVFRYPPQDIYYDRIENVVWSPQGLGADDRAGIFSILYIINQGFRPHIIFTEDEEFGGIGAGLLSEEPCPFSNLKYIIELDRCNYNDCVFYDCNSEKFESYITSFGFKTNKGTYSDICDLCPAWNVAGVNLSIGYKNEHSMSETLFVSQMFKTIKKVIIMLQNPPEEKFEFEFLYTPQYFTCYDCIAYTNREQCEKLRLNGLCHKYEEIFNDALT